MPLWNAGKDIKKKRVLVRPNLAWAMSGLNYLETGCLPSHNGSTMKLKEYSWFFYFFVATLYFSNCFKKMSQKICFMKIRMLLQKRFQPIERVEPNLRYLPHFCRFFFTNLNFLPLYEGFNNISDIKRCLMRK